MSSRLAERIQPVIRFRRIGLEALAVGTGQALAAIGAVVGVRVLTEAMTPHAYGELALAMTIATLGLQIFLSPLGVAAMRFFAPSSEAGDLRGFLFATRRLLAQSVTLVGVIAVLGVVVLLAFGKAAWIPLTVAAFLFTVFNGSASVIDGMQNAARHRVVASAHSGLAPWLRFLVAIWLIHLASNASSGMAMAGYAIASAVVLVSQLLFFRAQTASVAAAGKGDEEHWRKAMLDYGLPFVTWGVFTWAQLASDRWALGTFAGAADVGYYAVVYQLGYYPILMASTLLGQLLAPVLFARAGDASDPARVRNAVQLNARLAGLMVGLTIVGAIVAALVHPLIGRLFLAAEYRGVTHLLPWMVLAGGLFATGQIASLFFMITNRSKSLTAPKIGAALLGIAMNFAGARWLGLGGVVGASIAFSVVYTAWILIIALRTYRIGAAA